jgi:hypothetical protein
LTYPSTGINLVHLFDFHYVLPTKLTFSTWIGEILYQNKLPNLQFFTKIWVNSCGFTKTHTFSRKFTRIHVKKCEFTNFHTFSRNLFFTGMDGTANNAKNCLS